MTRLLDVSIFGVSLGTFAFSWDRINAMATSGAAAVEFTTLLYAVAAFLTAISAFAIAAVRVWHIVQHLRAGVPIDNPEKPADGPPSMEHIDRPAGDSIQPTKGESDERDKARFQNV